MEKYWRALLVVAVAAAAMGLADASFREDCNITWNRDNAKFSDDGHGLALSLVSNTSGCALQTYKQFIYGSVSTFIQLVPGNSAGTVTTYYTSSVGANHDEIDFEFLGNETGQPYTIHTNVFADGVGHKEMQFRPWFNPTEGFHNYTISWTPCRIVWYVDRLPIRVFRNYESNEPRVPFPTRRPMYGYSSIWSADDWATQGGRVKTNWSKAPFVANYRDMVLDVCACNSGGCDYSCKGAWSEKPNCAALSYADQGTMKWVQDNYRIYNYCDNYKNGTVPGPECYLPQN